MTSNFCQGVFFFSLTELNQNFSLPLVNEWGRTWVLCATNKQLTDNWTFNVMNCSYLDHGIMQGFGVSGQKSYMSVWTPPIVCKGSTQLGAIVQSHYFFFLFKAYLPLWEFGVNCNVPGSTCCCNSRLTYVCAMGFLVISTKENKLNYFVKM